MQFALRRKCDLVNHNTNSCCNLKRSIETGVREDWTKEKEKENEREQVVYCKGFLIHLIYNTTTQLIYIESA